MALDKTWQVGLAWGVGLSLLTVLATWYGVQQDSTMPLGLPMAGWLLFMVWLEKGVKA